MYTYVCRNKELQHHNPSFRKSKMFFTQCHKNRQYQFNGNTFTSDLDCLIKNTMGDVI